MTDAEYQLRLKAVNADIAASQAKVTSATSARTTQEAVGRGKSWWSVHDAMTISASVLIFGVLVLLLAAFMVRRGRSADSSLKLLGTLLIIISAVFLVVAGYDDKQIAPVMGLLGTIAGYLLGKGSVSAEERVREVPASPEPKKNETPPAGGAIAQRQSEREVSQG